MQHAPKDTLPTAGPGHRTAGVDWARDDHAVAIVDAYGRVVERLTVAHTAAGIRDLVRRLAKRGTNEVAIERPDGPVVEALLEDGLTVVVISPNQLKHLRSRYGSAGNKDDRFDAFVLADTLRTDRARLRPLVPDSPPTMALRAACRARKDLVGHRIALANQLRAHLQRAFPGAVGLFADIDSPINLRFLARFDCQERADWLSPKRLAAWLASVGYCGRVAPATLHARLAAAPRGAIGEEGAAQAHVTRALLAALTTLVEQIKALAEQIDEQLALHADAHVFTSRRLPLGRRQAAPGRHLRLRRRLAPRQPLGGRPLPPRHRSRPRPPARGPDPRPRLAVRDLALLAGRHALRPGPAPRTPGAPPAGRLT